MKIYFAGSIRGGREDVKIYLQIIKHLRKYGLVLTEHIADEALFETGEQQLSDKEIHDRDLDWLMQSDVMVAEVSVPSLGVGYEIRTAIEKNKRILCLYRNQPGKSLSAMIAGANGLVVESYNRLDEAIEKIDIFFIK